MTDKELLALAAKAAGIKIAEWHPNLNMARGAFFLEDGNCWNPLTDDGDALRLEVKLGIDTIQHNKMSEGTPECAAFYGEVRVPVADPDAATRRAIVRAAAEIGRSMK